MRDWETTTLILELSPTPPIVLTSIDVKSIDVINLFCIDLYAECSQCFAFVWYLCLHEPQVIYSTVQLPLAASRRVCALLVSSATSGPSLLYFQSPLFSGNSTPDYTTFSSCCDLPIAWSFLHSYQGLWNLVHSLPLHANLSFTCLFKYILSQIICQDRRRC